MKNYFKKTLLYFCSSFLLAILLGVYGCSDTTVTPPGSTLRSDLTRTGKFISFTSNKDGNYDIFIAQVDANGNLATTGLLYPSNPFNLTSNFSTLTDKQSNWSPDGRVLVYSLSQASGAEEIYAFFFKADGSIDSLVTPNPKRLFSSSGNWDENPSFSPNGAYLIWDRREDNNGGGIDSSDSRDLFIGDVTGSGNSLAVLNPRPISNTLGGDEYNPKWSPRNSVRKVAYEYQASATSNDHDVYVIDPLDSINNVNFYNPNNSGYPAWSPVCDRIIFESDKTSGNYWKIVYLPYPASGNPTDFVDAPGFNSRYPTRLPNGDYLAYIRITISTGTGNIYVTTTAGGTGNKLLTANFDNFNNLWPAW